MEHPPVPASADGFKHVRTPFISGAAGERGRSASIRPADVPVTGRWTGTKASGASYQVADAETMLRVVPTRGALREVR